MLYESFVTPDSIYGMISESVWMVTDTEGVDVKDGVNGILNILLPADKKLVKESILVFVSEEKPVARAKVLTL